jgi:hypothetical protein
VGGGLVALSLAVVLATAWEPKYGRDDWRAAAAAVGTPSGERLLVVTPGSSAIQPLEYYLPGSRPVERAPAVREVDLLALPRRPLGSVGETKVPPVDPRRPPPTPRFLLVERRRGEHFVLLRYRARRPAAVPTAALRGAALDDVQPALMLQAPG